MKNMRKSISCAILLLSCFATAFAENSPDETALASHRALHNIVVCRDDRCLTLPATINGVCFETDINYVLSETAKDVKLEEAIRGIYKLRPAAEQANYYYNYVDLDGDGTKEIFVFLQGPFFSGTGGNSALLFKNQSGQYQLISQFTLVRNPILISKNKTNGWKNIILPVSGGGIAPFFAVLHFDGTGYQTNPSIAPKLGDGRADVEMALIANNLMRGGGIPL